MNITRAPFLDRNFFKIKAILQNGRYGLLLDEIRRHFYSRDTHYELRYDLGVPVNISEPRIGLSLRELREDDVHKLFNLNDSSIDNLEFMDRLLRLIFIRENIPTCYVAVTNDGKPCHATWMFTAKENKYLQSCFGKRYRKLEHNEVSREYSYTLPEFRGFGIYSWATSCILKKASEMGARYVYSGPVKASNRGMLTLLKKIGFRVCRIRNDRWLFFRRTFTFVDTPPE